MTTVPKIVTARLGKGTKPQRVLLVRIVNAGRTAVIRKLDADGKPHGAPFNIDVERVSQ